MYSLKSIKLYFFSILKLFFLSFRNYYLKTKFYNKKLVTFIPDRIFYNPSSYLSASLLTTSSDFYKITNTLPELLWKTNKKDKSTLKKSDNVRKTNPSPNHKFFINKLMRSSKMMDESLTICVRTLDGN